MHLKTSQYLAIRGIENWGGHVLNEAVTVPSNSYGSHSSMKNQYSLTLPAGVSAVSGVD